MTERSKKGFVVVLIFGLLLGYFVWKTFWGYTPHLYPVSFKLAQWITPVEESPQGYYRKEVFIPEEVAVAWIKLAATDSFKVYVNGKRFGDKLFNSLNVSGIYDLNEILHTGKNIIGVVVRRKSYPGSSRLAVEGGYMDQYGVIHPFASDESWKVTLYEQRQGDGEILWYEESFDPTEWSYARSAGNPKSQEIYPLDVNPDIFSASPSGEWIWHPDPLVSIATFEHEIILPKRTSEAWIGVATDGVYELAINGLKIDSNDSQEKSLRIYNIAPILRSGKNKITIGVKKGPWGGGLLVNGFVMQGDVSHTLKTDSKWRVIAA